MFKSIHIRDKHALLPLKYTSNGSDTQVLNSSSSVLPFIAGHTDTRFERDSSILCVHAEVLEIQRERNRFPLTLLLIVLPLKYTLPPLVCHAGKKTFNYSVDIKMIPTGLTVQVPSQPPFSPLSFSVTHFPEYKLYSLFMYMFI